MNKKKLKIAVLGSTRGTNLEAIFNTIQTGELDVEIIAVISDKKNAYILERARSYGLPAFFIDPKDFNKREDYDKNIIEKLKNEKTDLVLLIGYMRILSLCFVEQFKNKIMNIHPSLLPAFAGGMDMDVHKLVIEQEVVAPLSSVTVTECDPAFRATAVLVVSPLSHK